MESNFKPDPIMTGLFVGILFFFAIPIYVSDWLNDIYPIQAEQPVKHEWDESLVEVTFKEGRKDTFKLDINVTANTRIHLDKGDLIYDKAWYKSGGGGGSYQTAASFVSSFKILSADRKSLTR